MKTFMVTAILTLSITFNAVAVSADQSLIDLKKAETIITALPDMYKYQSLDKENDPVLKQQDKAFKILEEAVKAYLESPEDQLLLAEILKIASASNKKDPWVYASEIVSPIAVKQRARFEKALKTLPSSEASNLQKSIQNAIRENSKGNG
ncbi:hypothetical protein [Bdellovibrio sp. GT3]|uniref:hypothetical protein n=1 Tax=Bdellovibrio sp. GT3 TaxID=3136282 RepID=UPI0030F041BD